MIFTSGSTIGTKPAAWHVAAYLKQFGIKFAEDKEEEDVRWLLKLLINQHISFLQSLEGEYIDKSKSNGDNDDDIDQPS